MGVQFESRPYRKNVAAVVLNAEGAILCCRRSDFPSAWQLPQGGLELDETPEQALLRELEEEIGTNDVEVIGRLEEAIRYDWPQEVAHKKYRGQEQIYFLVRLQPYATINLESRETAEFDLYEWLSLTEFLSRLDRTARGGFKTAAYAEAMQKLEAKYPGMIRR